MEQAPAGSFWDQPKSYQLTMLGHVFMLLGTAAFSAAKLASMAERGSMPEEPRGPFESPGTPISAKDYFEN